MTEGEPENEDAMRIITDHILPLIAAAVTSGLLLSAAYV
jgi:hypothetical protein